MPARLHAARLPAARLPVTARAALVACLALLLVVQPDASGAAPRKLGAVAGPLRLVPADGVLEVGGLGSYFGTIRVSSESDGLVVVNRLALERYLLGLNEVPTDWPEEALKAQAVAARTYALYTLAQPAAGSAAVYGFDICATVECQVFSGADVVRVADGVRWARAVQATEGETLLYRGAPILARYHSTSGGATLDNPQAFPGETGYPYLQGVPSTTEEGSPLYRWRVTFPLPRLQLLLERAGWWGPSAGKLISVETRASRTGLHYPDIVFRGRRSSHRTTAETFRDLVRELAPSMFPDAYPSAAPTASGRLPETLPSNRLTIRTRGKDVEIVGRGWGHGVGMSQWGAEGLARRGATYDEILGHYYTGVTLGRVEQEAPIDVGIGSGRSVVAVTGDYRIVDARGKEIVERALGTWTFGSAGSGAVAIDPPRGYGLPLRLGVVEAPEVVDPGQEARFTIALSRPARVRVEGPDGERSTATVRDAGRQAVEWRAPTEPGRYQVVIRASTGPRSRAETVPVVVRAPDEPVLEESPAVAAEPEGERPSGTVVALVAAVLLALSVAAMTLKGRIR